MLADILLKEKPKEILPAWIIEELEKQKRKEQEKRQPQQLPLYLPEPDEDYKK